MADDKTLYEKESRYFPRQYLLAYTFNETGDKISVSTFREYLDMLLQNERNLRPQTPRLKYPEISMTKNVLDNLQTKSRGAYHSHQTIHQNYQIVRKRYKKIIRSTKSSFWRKVLCSQNP